MALNERAALAAVVGLNRGSRGLLDLEEALVVRELVRGQGLTGPEVGELLGHDKSWVCRRLMLVERLDETVQSDVRVGLVPVSVAREVVRLPRGNQPEVAQSVHRHGLTSREAVELVRLFEGTAGRDAQQALLDDPRAVLARHRGEGRRPSLDPRLSPEANALQGQAGRVLEGLVRLERQVSAQPVGPWSRAERDVLGPVLRQVASTARLVGQHVASVADAMERADGARP